MCEFSFRPGLTFIMNKSLIRFRRNQIPSYTRCFLSFVVCFWIAPPIFYLLYSKKRNENLLGWAIPCFNWINTHTKRKWRKMNVANQIYSSIFYNNLQYWLRFFYLKRSVGLNSKLQPWKAIISTFHPLF